MASPFTAVYLTATVERRWFYVPLRYVAYRLCKYGLIADDTAVRWLMRAVRIEVR